MTRTYPIIDDQTTKPTRATSIVCVHYSGDFEHNIFKSDCVHDSLNEFIVVDNRMNMAFDTLGQAINHGIKGAKNDLVAVAHEDILLVPGWQSRLEKSLIELEKHDPDWGIAGAVGWTDDLKMVGHWSDPQTYTNTFETSSYCQVSRLDEQILIFRKSQGISPDPKLPSIHNIGADIARQITAKGLKTYAIDAPTIHKYADQNGNPIQCAEDSPKIKDRMTLTYLADEHCSGEYFSRKWSLSETSDSATFDIDYRWDIDSPIILLGRGGSGTRLLSTLATDAGLFIGNDVNPSGDCMDMVPAIYRSIVRKYRCPDIEQKMLSFKDLRQAAIKMIGSDYFGKMWGFKLPELLLILPEIHLAFPNAKFVNFKRRPAGTVLRRSHMTARLDNHIGRIALKEAYQYFSCSMSQLLNDDTLTRMVITTMHQLAITENFRTTIPQDRWLEINFEETISNPEKQLETFANFCGLPIQNKNIISIVSPSRSQREPNKFSNQEIKRVEEEIAQYSLQQK